MAVNADEASGISQTASGYKMPTDSEEPTVSVKGNAPEALQSVPFLQKDMGFISVADLNRTKDDNGKLRRKMRMAAYIRVSTDSADQENSYETQERYFLSLLKHEPDRISAGIYSDRGISGTSSAGRTGYNRLLRHCREGRIDRIVCKSISRFARNTGDFIAALGILHESHVTICFEKEGLDTADPVSDFILTTLAAIAEEESRSISANLRWGNLKRCPMGQIRNYDIYGYRYASGENAAQTFEDGYRIRRLEIAEDEAAVIRRIFDEVEMGETFSAIAVKLNLENIPAPNHGKKRRKIFGRTTVRDGIETGWSCAMISRMVRMERYCGDVLTQKTYTPDHLAHKSVKNEGALPQYLVRSHHPAIISREQFERVQRIISGSGRVRKRHSYSHYPFSGLLICSCCGRAYTIRNTGSYPIWFCPTSALHNGRDICRAKKVYEERAIGMLRRAFTDRFRLLEDAAADIASGSCAFGKRADCFVEQIKKRLLNIRDTDFSERDEAFLKKRRESLRHDIFEASERIRRLLSDKGAAQEDRELRIAYEEEAIKNAEHKIEELELMIACTEDYRERLEADHEEREAALEWIDSLPKGREGTAAFLNGLTGYVKAFVLSVTVHDPLHYTVHWFDDTYTEVEMHSDVEDHRSAKAFYDANDIDVFQEEMRRICRRKEESYGK